jgi:Tfp pilus assembly protein FimT
MIEIVVFIAVLGILAGTAGVRFHNRPTEFLVSVQRLVSQLEYAKLAAMNSGALVGFEFDSKNHTYTGSVIADPPLPASPFPYEPYTFSLQTGEIKVNVDKSIVLFNGSGLIVDQNGKLINKQVQIEMQSGELSRTVYIENGTGRIHL